MSFILFLETMIYFEKIFISALKQVYKKAPSIEKEDFNSYLSISLSENKTTFIVLNDLFLPFNL